MSRPSSTWWWPTSAYHAAERRKGSRRLQCDECGDRFAPWRITQVVGGSSVAAAGYANAYNFCDGCHAGVFAEASHEKYPELFELTVPLVEEMRQWQLAGSMAKLFGLKDAKSFSGRLREGNHVFGRQVEWGTVRELREQGVYVQGARTNEKLYRVVG